MFGQSVHPDAQPPHAVPSFPADTEDEDLAHLEEQQRLASELARLLTLEQSDDGDALPTHAEIRAWLQELLARGTGAGVGEA
jgi:hypothetical protein